MGGEGEERERDGSSFKHFNFSEKSSSVHLSHCVAQGFRLSSVCAGEICELLGHNYVVICVCDFHTVHLVTFLPF